ncbi:MAG: hypothetical protein CMP22_05620 [Rickettsiales bacterium]|nr:hypothetical protein [Rickettsiales bacterium]
MYRTLLNNIPNPTIIIAKINRFSHIPILDLPFQAKNAPTLDINKGNTGNKTYVKANVYDAQRPHRCSIYMA